MPFGEIQTMLGEEARFLACNRGVLINMDEVRSFDGECFVMNGAQRFPIRLSEKMPIRERFYQYIFRKTRGVGMRWVGMHGAGILWSCCFVCRQDFYVWLR